MSDVIGAATPEVLEKTTKTVEIDSHSINFGPQHPAAHACCG
jgi:NADH:ubiquinone oxidoreductase subunit D